jgi:hypothetical protein
VAALVAAHYLHDLGKVFGSRRLSEELPRELTHDLYGNVVSGVFWDCMEPTFRDCAARHRAARRETAALIADRLADTTNSVPAQLMQEFQDLYFESIPPDYDESQWFALQLDLEMEDEFARGYSSENATAFVLDFIRRMTGARPS